MNLSVPVSNQTAPFPTKRTTYGIFSCENGWDCADSLIISVMSVVTLIFYIRASNIIAKDRAKLLGKTEKVVFNIALAQIAVVAFVKTFYDSYFWHSTLQTISLIKDICICVVIAYNYFLEQHYETVHKTAQAGVVIAAVLWVYSFIENPTTSLDATCSIANNLLFSGMNLLVSGVSAAIGYLALKLMIRFQNEEYGNEKQTQVWEMKHLEMKNKQIEITVLLVATVSANVVAFLWDIHKFIKGDTRDRCWAFYHAPGLSMFLKNMVLDLWTILIPLWAIYYVYFMRYQSYFKQATRQEFRSRLSDFDDPRSEMIELDSTTEYRQAP